MVKRSYKKISLFLITMLLLPTFSLLFIPRVSGNEQAYQNISIPGNDQAYQNISVPDAYRMIKENKDNEVLIILDVRTEEEYSRSHLYNSLVIPHDEIESRITELEDYKNSKIIVYCKSGARSQIASEFLFDYGFSEIYYMMGGIDAWVDEGYSIWSISHRVTVENPKRILIEPIIPIPYNLSDCGCCSNDNYEDFCPNNADITSTIIEEAENYVITNIVINLNDTIDEFTLKTTYLWNSTETSSKFTKTTRFTSIEIFSDDLNVKQFYLSYEVKHDEYNLTVITILTLLDEETYSNSETIITFTSTEKTLNTYEFVEFNNSPISLSKSYDILGKAASKLKTIYLKSFAKTKDEGFKQLSINYNAIKKELNTLSRFVKEKLTEYDLLIFENHATINDACNPVMFLLCMVVIQGIDLFGCDVGPWLFCFLSSTALGFLIGPYGIIYSFICGGMFLTMCQMPDRATREWWTIIMYGC